jgi:hypothetical protein
MSEAVLPLLADEGFDGHIVRGLRRRHVGIDLVTIQELGRRRDRDDQILARAAAEGRVVLARDKSTLVPEAWDRVARGEPMPGVIVVPEWYPVGLALSELAEILAAGADGLVDQVVFLPRNKAWRVSEDVAVWATAGT